MWDEIVREATQLAVAGKINEGMALIQVNENRSLSQRERFLWRLHQAQLCMQIQAFEVAMYQLEFLDEQIGRFGLETWEPSLCIEVLKLLLICYYSVSQKTKSAPSQFAVKIEQTYTRLCRLDAAIALQLRDKTFFSSLPL
jgi:type VI secretion system protein VasJ